MQTQKQINFVIDKLAQAQACGQLPTEITLSSYADDDALLLFRPEERWEGGAKEHLNEMLNASAQISARFPSVHVKIAEISIAEFFAWLSANDKNDSPATRAEYVATLS